MRTVATLAIRFLGLIVLIILRIVGASSRVIAGWVVLWLVVVALSWFLELRRRDQ
jgi:hypothetical protein